MESIKCNNFFKKWKSICKANEERLISEWNNPIEYTKIVLKGENSITAQLAIALNLKIAFEYYSVDSIFYIDEDKVIEKADNNTWEKIDSGIWLTKFRIAFEHENIPNGPKGAYQEICHLLNLKADLKVLVTYWDKEFINTFIDDLNSIISISSQEEVEILVIVGYKSIKNIVWNGFMLKGKNGIEEI